MNFKRWLEYDDHDWVADKWMRERPSPDNIKPVMREVEEWAFAHADDFYNEKLMEYVKNFHFTDETRYRNKIAGNLLTTDDPRLGWGVGMVSNNRKADFSFTKGSIRIIHPLVIFGKYDEDLLVSIILHELQHAIDWLKPEFAKVPPSGKYDFDWSLYSTNLYEARGYALQLEGLLRKLGSVEEVEKALTTSEEFGLKDDLLKVAKIFLRKLSMNELYIPSNVEVANKAAMLVSRFINSMLFRNFVEKS